VFELLSPETMKTDFGSNELLFSSEDDLPIHVLDDDCDLEAGGPGQCSLPSLMTSKRSEVVATNLSRLTPPHLIFTGIVLTQNGDSKWWRQAAFCVCVP
jgi:hypothetical protein